MSHLESREKSGKISSWPQAISEAEEMLKRVKRKAKRLETHIAMMKESLNTGEPWKDEKAGTEAESIPA